MKHLTTSSGSRETTEVGFVLFCFVFGNLLAVLDLHSCAGFSLVVERGSYFLVVMRRLLIAVASLVAEHRLQGAWASVAAVPGL